MKNRPMPTPLQAMQAKSTEELLRIKKNMPSRIKAAGSIISEPRRKQALAKLLGESHIIDQALLLKAG